MKVGHQRKSKVKINQRGLFLFCIPLICVILVLQCQVVKRVSNSEPSRAHTLRKNIQPTKTSFESQEVAFDYDGLIVDFMSIGSKTRIHYQEAQRKTFASHKSIRFFFNITEMDDPDPTCSDTLQPEDTLAISDFCRHRAHWKPGQSLMRYLRSPYARKPWLRRKVSPQGWMCAQVRPSHGLGKVVEKYRALEFRIGHRALPDYLFIGDDDTYVNFELFEQYMSTFDTAIPRAVAGCMIRSPIVEVNFTIPFGGFGMIFSRAAIQNYIRPVRCSDNKLDDFSRSACRRIEEDQIGEKSLFQDGMSVSDLQLAYAASQPYTKYKTWRRGFCLHSDWMWGYFSNFYNISKHNDEQIWNDVPQARMDGYNHSEIYAGDGDNFTQHAGLPGICNNEKEVCDSSSHICHYQKPEDMRRLALEIQQAFPHKFDAFI